MAKFGVFKNGFIQINGVDLSDHCTEFSLPITAAELPNHAHGDEVEQTIPGLFNWSIPCKFLQDFAGGSVDDTLWPLMTGRTIFVVECRPDQGAISPTNPQYSGYAQLYNYQPVQGAHGVNLITDCLLKPASGAMLGKRTS